MISGICVFTDGCPLVLLERQRQTIALQNHGLAVEGLDDEVAVGGDEEFGGDFVELYRRIVRAVVVEGSVELQLFVGAREGKVIKVQFVVVVSLDKFVAHAPRDGFLEERGVSVVACCTMPGRSADDALGAFDLCEEPVAVEGSVVIHLVAGVERCGANDGEDGEEYVREETFHDFSEGEGL